jgi:3-hydroxy-3-methylglutaryl CoA synthase
MADPKIGLVSVGGYVPRYRLSGQTVAQVWGGGGGGRAVANYDEDALTMACEAALNAIGARAVSGIGACFFASTSAPYVEKSSATLLASVVDLGAGVLTADLGGSLRCGTTALRLALDTVRAGSAAEALVAAADMRPVAPGGELEMLVGDGAGAALIGTADVIASFEGAFTASHEFTDFWRNDGERYVQSLPDLTFIKAHGLDKHIPEAIDGLLRKTGRKREDVARLVLYGPDARTHAALVRQLKFPEAAVPGEPATRVPPPACWSWPPSWRRRSLTIRSWWCRTATGRRRCSSRRRMRSLASAPRGPWAGSSPPAGRSGITASSCDSAATSTPRSSARSRASRRWCGRNGRTFGSTARSAPTAAP